MRHLKILKVLKSESRIPGVDTLRALAIITVVLFHFNKSLPLGYIGVDLFFVISGFLVGGILLKKYMANQPISFPRFFLARGFKIWPSYYFFIIGGTLVAYLFYAGANRDQIIQMNDFFRYLFFYQNYTGVPFHWSFDHVWSLCVEEHFYIFFPLVVIFLVKFKMNKKYFPFVLVIFILLGLVSKLFMFYFTNGKDTYSATNNRIDALAWGVLVNYLVNYTKVLERRAVQLVALLLGGLILSGAIYFKLITTNVIFDKIGFHTILPLSFALLLMAFYYMNLSFIMPLRIVAYYSYNWYLWHPVFSIIITQWLGFSFYSGVIYLCMSFLTAVFTTMIIEEPFLHWRDKLLSKK